jgi:phosphoenolpyruvate synthase/pyruvate phosphate dikinase
MSSRSVRMHLISLRRAAGTLSEGRKELGGKAQGLLSIGQVLEDLRLEFPELTIDIPAMVVLDTSVFDAFVQRNNLERYAASNQSDDRIAHAFLRGNLPFEVLGELRALVHRWTMPLAVRSSGLLEDTMQRPFAGVYGTKMIPNNAYDADTRFQKLVEAIKYVWASTYFKIARDYCEATGLDIGDEKMAVIIQQVVGKRHGDRFYPRFLV